MALYGFDILGLLSQAGSAALDIGTATVNVERQREIAAREQSGLLSQMNVPYNQWILPLTILIISGTLAVILFRKKT